MKFGTQFAVLLGMALAAPAFAQKPADDHSAHHSGTQTKSPALAEGEVRKVDKKAGTLTIKHGPIQAIDMPAMTMMFQVKEASMLDRVKAGDKVKFQAEMGAGGKVTVTQIEPLK
jgi:Cu/Ag efflux protein CusF